MNKKLSKIYEITSSLYSPIELYLNNIIESFDYLNILFSNLIILPNKKVLNRVREYLGENLSNYPIGYILTLKELKEKVLAYIRVEEKLNKNYALSKIGKHLIISKIVGEIKNEYSEKSITGNYLNKLISPSKFVNDIQDFIKTLKTAFYKLFSTSNVIDDGVDTHYNASILLQNKWSEEFIKKIEKTIFKELYKNSHDKYNDIFEIINRYEKEKDRFKLMDDEDMLIQTINHLNTKVSLDSPYFNRIKNIYVFGLYDLSLLDANLLNTLATCLDANIKLSIYKSKSNKYLFKYLTELDFQQEEIKIDDYKKLNARSSPLYELSSLLFDDESLLNQKNINEIKSIDFTNNINFIEKNNREEEVKTVAKIIKSIFRTNKNINPEDILIIAPNLSSYKSFLKNIFTDIGIDIHISGGESLLNSKLIYVLLNILELKLYNFRYSDFIKLVKSNYVFIRKKDGIYTREYSSIIENFFSERKISEYNFVNQIEGYIEKREKYNKTNNIQTDNTLNKLKEAVEYIYRVKDIFYNKENGLSFPKPDKKLDFYDLIIVYRKLIEDDLSILLNVFVNKERKTDDFYYSEEDIEISKRDSILCGRFLEVIEELGFYYNHINEKISLREFHDILKQTLVAEQFYEDTDFRGKVQVYSIDEALCMKFKHAFMLGMVENEFPRRNIQNVFINDKDKITINKLINTSLFKTTEDFYNREEELFKLILDLISKKLYLCSIRESKGKIALKSFFIDEIQEILKNNTEELNPLYNADEPDAYYYSKEFIEKTLNIYSDEFLETINSIESKSQTISLGETFHTKITNFEKFIKSYIKIDEYYLKRVSEIILMESLRENDSCYTDYDGYIFYKTGSEKIGKYLENKFKSISPTSFEMFGVCPIRFFFIKALGMKEPKAVEDILSAPVRGTAIHSILEKFYKDYVIKELENINDINFEEIKKTLKTKLEELINSKFDSLNEDNKIANYELFKLNQLERIKIKIFNFFEIDFNFLKDKGYIPKHFEFSFGMKDESSKEALKLIDENANFIINVKGSIDRIDEPKNAIEPLNIRLSDYKTGNAEKSENKIRKEIKEGKMFQPTLYSLSVLNNNEFDYDVVDWAFYYIFKLKKKIPTISLKKDSEEIKSSIKYIKDYKNKIINGKFNLAPRECPPFCKFTDACRYVKYKTEEKRDKSNFWN